MNVTQQASPNSNYKPPFRLGQPLESATQTSDLKLSMRFRRLPRSREKGSPSPNPSNLERSQPIVVYFLRPSSSNSHFLLLRRFFSTQQALLCSLNQQPHTFTLLTN
ncbi:hypothetical protein KC19_VG058000 [Ceratodon purpureus]|uniref:Uncharacterized protein n=1 Tax=Ceratodon purpureus TaxID=3225 RepID=A0A8T0HME1_CERPU|nr:hypothetical protein KC19_VG058000 [Ceratodon purpureus]